MSDGYASTLAKSLGTDKPMGTVATPLEYETRWLDHDLIFD